MKNIAAICFLTVIALMCTLFLYQYHTYQFPFEETQKVVTTPHTISGLQNPQYSSIQTLSQHKSSLSSSFTISNIRSFLILATEISILTYYLATFGIYLYRYYTRPVSSYWSYLHPRYLFSVVLPTIVSLLSLYSYYQHFYGPPQDRVYYYTYSNESPLFYYFNLTLSVVSLLLIPFTLFPVFYQYLRQELFDHNKFPFTYTRIATLTPARRVVSEILCSRIYLGVSLILILSGCIYLYIRKKQRRDIAYIIDLLSIPLALVNIGSWILQHYLNPIRLIGIRCICNSGGLPMFVIDNLPIYFTLKEFKAYLLANRNLQMDASEEDYLNLYNHITEIGPLAGTNIATGTRIQYTIAPAPSN